MVGSDVLVGLQGEGDVYWGEVEMENGRMWTMRGGRCERVETGGQFGYGDKRKIIVATSVAGTNTSADPFWPCSRPGPHSTLRVTIVV